MFWRQHGDLDAEEGGAAHGQEELRLGPVQHHKHTQQRRERSQQRSQRLRSREGGVCASHNGRRVFRWQVRVTSPHCFDTLSLGCRTPLNIGVCLQWSITHVLCRVMHLSLAHACCECVCTPAVVGVQVCTPELGCRICQAQLLCRSKSNSHVQTASLVCHVEVYRWCSSLLRGCVCPAR